MIINFFFKTIFRKSILDDEDLYEYSIDPTDMRLNTYYYMIYCMWMNFFFMGLGPFVVLITLNTWILIKLKEMAKEREMDIGNGLGG